MQSEMYEISCANCGIIFWITKAFNGRLMESKASFRCPQGHLQSYEGDTCEERLRKKEDELQRSERAYSNTRDREDRACRRITAYKGVVTKMKKKQEQEQ